MIVRGRSAGFSTAPHDDSVVDPHDRAGPHHRPAARLPEAPIRCTAIGIDNSTVLLQIGRWSGVSRAFSGNRVRRPACACSARSALRSIRCQAADRDERWRQSHPPRRRNDRPDRLIVRCAASGKLRLLEVGAEAEPATVFIAYPYARRVSAKVLELTAHLRAAFGRPPYWEQ